MRKVAVVVAVFVGVLATVWTAPTAGADPRMRGRSAGRPFGGDRSFHTHGHSFHKHGFGHGFGHHRVFPRHFVTFGAVIAPPVVVYSSPPLVYAPPPYHAAPVFAPPAVYSPPVYAQPAPAPRVVEYSTGRYELRGDGISTPYTWVWIPNPPPPPPPPAAPPTAPPAGAPTSGDAAPARRTTVYRWVDEHGVVHLTDRSETVPPRYREEARRFKPS